MLRMEIALFLMLAFVGYIYFSAEKQRTPLHKTFSLLLVTVLVHLVFDGAVKKVPWRCAVTLLLLNQRNTPFTEETAMAWMRTPEKRTQLSEKSTYSNQGGPGIL